MLERVPVKTRVGSLSARPKASTPEVEFALVLSRLIEAAESDPTQLRSSIYEIARVRLKEQLALESPVERQRLLEALETAIGGVEDFSQRNGGLPALLANRFAGGGSEEATSDRLRRFVAKRSQIEAPKAGDVETKRGVPFGVFKVLNLAFRSLAILAVAGAAVYYFASQYRREGGVLPSTKQPVEHSASKETVPFGDKWAAVDDVSGSDKPPNPLLPDHFGVFAVSSNQLYELEQLPGRAPDMRVAISATITQPVKTTLPDGRVKFVVYRRDSALNAVEKADVRLFARVSNKGPAKSSSGQEADGWVIRNIAYPLIVAPIKEASEMYELRSEQSDFSLSPGRYVLVLRGTTFDFAVQGDVTDPKQCLERLQANNGVFYAECGK